MESPIICRLVSAVSKAKETITDDVTASRVIMMSSMAWRPPSTAQFLGVLGLMRPVVLAVEVDQLVREEELQLRVPHLVEHAVDRHVAHRVSEGAEAGHPRLELAGLILGQGHGARSAA